MINRLALSTFQAHDHTEIDFVPGVNVIVGASDSGKSSILRALRWAVENRPAGDALKSHWSDGVSVTVETDTHKIVRSKGRENVYQLDGETFKAFGQDVPDPIKAAFGFHDVNMAAQLDAPFLLSSTPGEVARYLNSVVGLDAIDTALQNIGSTQREVGREVKRWREDAERHREEASALSWVTDAIADIEAAEACDERMHAHFDEIESLSAVLNELGQIENVAVPDVGEDLTALAEIDRGLERIRGEVAVLEEMIAGCVMTEKLCVDAGAQLVAMELKLAAIAPKICPTCGQEMPVCRI